MLFIENVGQFADGARFQAWGASVTLWVAEDAIWLTVVESRSDRIYFLPSDQAYDIAIGARTTTETAGSANPQSVSVVQFGQGYAAGVSELPLSSGQTDRIRVTNNGKGVAIRGSGQKEAALILTLDEGSGGLRVAVAGADVRSGQTVALSADARPGAIAFDSSAAAGGAYDLSFVRITATRAVRFAHARISITGGDTHFIDYESWSGGTMTIGVDHGSDGIIDEQQKINNEIRHAYLPAALRGHPANGSITGRVVSATTGQPIAGARLCVLGTSQCTDSDPEGNYALTSIPAGGRTVRATAGGYTPLEQAIIVPAGGRAMLNFALSRFLAQGEIRIVLTWGEHPRDLDSHLWLPAATPYHIYFDDKGRCEVFPHACLDTDDTTGYGPETVTIKQRYNGTYTCAVHLFDGDGTLSTSDARIQVYGPAGLIVEYAAPAAGTGRWWYVFDLDGATGALTPRNIIGADPPRATLTTSMGTPVGK